MALLGGYAAYNYRSHETLAHRSDEARAALVAEIVKNGLVNIMIEGRSHELEGFLKTLVAEELQAVRVRSVTGEVLASSVPALPAGALPLPEGYLKNPTTIITRTHGPSEAYEVVLPLMNEKPCQRCHGMDKDMLAVIDVTLESRSMSGLRAEFHSRALVALAVLFALTLAIVAAITRKVVLLPVGDLLRRVGCIRDGQQDATLPTDRDDELGALSKRIDALNKDLCTARQRLEHSVDEADERTEKMATIGEMAAVIAHEIKNPLAGISGAIQVFADDMQESDPRKEIIKEVLGEIERLDKSVRDLLNYARPPELHLITVTASSFLERTAGLLQKTAKKQGVDVNIVTRSDEAAILNIDPDQMHQVFLNLMMNALQALPAGGSIALSCRACPDDGIVELSVSDTGPGIPKEMQANIFKPFFTTKRTGTGLGLAISKSIIERHGGYVRVESQMGVGTNFRILLPMADAPQGGHTK